MTSAVTIPTPQVKYLSVAETAAIVRKRLKKTFPGTKFSVRSSSYAGGASISIHYHSTTISQSAVSSVTAIYAGSAFDGMIDMAYNKTHFLNPDDSATLAHTPGSASSGGMNPEEFGDAAPGAILVSFGADYVFVTNDFHAPTCDRCIDLNYGHRCNCYWDNIGAANAGDATGS